MVKVFFYFCHPLFACTYCIFNSVLLFLSFETHKTLIYNIAGNYEKNYFTVGGFGCCV